MQEMNMRWRKDVAKKTFVERLVNLAAERVRRGLMPALRKKTKRGNICKSHKQKRLKSGTNHNFDPEIHVKEDPSTTSSTMDGIMVTTCQDKSISSVTDRDQEDSVILMIKKYYKDNNTRVLPLEVFEACRKAKLGYLHDSKDPNTTQDTTAENKVVHDQNNDDGDKEDTVIGNDYKKDPRLNDSVTEEVNFNSVPNTIMGPGSEEVILNMPPLEVVNEEADKEDTELLEPFCTCKEGQCEFKLEINNNPHESTITKDFGDGMKCVGVKCGKTLLECFKTKNINSAYVCKKCRTGDCKHMYCCGCFKKTDYAKTKEQKQGDRERFDLGNKKSYVDDL